MKICPLFRKLLKIFKYLEIFTFFALSSEKMGETEKILHQGDLVAKF